MNTTAYDLHVMAAYVNLHGLHTGNQFAAANNRLDICAIAYVVAEDCTVPAEFYTDEVASLRLIECSAKAMAAIRAISDALDSEPCETEIAPGHSVPDYIEHVSNWAAVPGLFATAPPSTSEVIGRILRAAEKTRQDAPRIASNSRPGFTDAYGFCLTCRGHGSLTTDGEEIPREELSPRRQQGYDLGHRFYRNTSKPCPDCDGQDRVTDAAVSAYEASL
ncbi:hypothetical protein OOK48_35215 [Streptomyces viridodiastaticus]|uniref:hypothetical protein n=1 Tax=Streptomyces albogriseolus TaxID=1887 RepID=UPI002254C64A|nr:hypothetical protein [Streptomyces viridodiastaticus]MCX4571573.1 hypothetical protein [Streptomyces viridodiastaticus]